MITDVMASPARGSYCRFFGPEGDVGCKGGAAAGCGTPGREAELKRQWLEQG